MIKLNESSYRHRDLNWLSFNERVLQEAEDKEQNPLYERLKFLAIYSTNLDEFFRVRVSQLRQLKRVKKSVRKQLSLQPNKIVKQIKQTVLEQQERFGKIFREDIVPELKENHIHLLSSEDFGDAHQLRVQEWFASHLQDSLETQLVRLTSDDSIFLENQSLYFCVFFEKEDTLGFVNIPSDRLDRFISLSEEQGAYYITFIDDIIRANMTSIFPNQSIRAVHAIKMSRDAELYLDDEIDGILADKIYASLKQRHKGQPTRLLYDAAMDKADAKKMRKLLGIGKVDMMPGGRYHNFNDFFRFPDPSENKVLHYSKMPLVKHSVLDRASDYFEVLREKDQLVHFPYMTFNYVERFVEQAAQDPDVTHIKISLYRVATESPLTTALLKALDNGKNVLIFIEAKARFDEENNITWGRTFEEKGAKVIYSYPRIKVHSKILLIRRKEARKHRNYVYIGTGNFNAKTSKLYSDHGLFSANKKIGKELNRVFRVLEGDLIVPRNKKLLVSPFTTRRVFEKLINEEIDQARQGKKAAISIKMNSLEDKEMIKLLYKASQEGVSIRMLVRGFTSLIPSKKGLSENIVMTSILDRYLEHGRIYQFYNGGDERLYIGSADWMTRNLDRRIEVLAPILDADCRAELKEILNIQMNDNCKARIQETREENTYVKREADTVKIRSQYAIFDFLKQQHSI